MAIYGSSPFGENDTEQLVGVQTNINGYFFDAVLKVDHSSILKITDHPVEEGAAITDHAFMERRYLTMEIGMSDVCSSYIGGQFASGASRSVSAYEALIEMQGSRMPMTVFTRLETYENMLIETITTPDDFTTMYGLRATVALREIEVVTTDTVALPNRTSTNSQKTGSTTKGTVQPSEQQPNRSLLNQMFGGG